MSTEIRFYHLQNQNLDQALPALLNKAIQTGQNIVIRTPNEEISNHLNDILWTQNPSSFLPHGTKKDGNADKQPIFISSAQDNPNNATICILTHGTDESELTNYALCCEIFDGRDESAVKNARQKWKKLKENEDLTLTYWQQSQGGSWEKKQ